MWNIVGVVLMILIPLLTVFAGVIPAIQGAQTTDVARQAAVANNVERAALLEQYKTDSLLNKDALATDLADLLTRVPDTANTAEFMNQLVVTSAQTGASVTKLSVTNPVTYVLPAGLAENAEVADALLLFPPDSVYVVNVTMSLAGTLPEITSFVRDIRTGARSVLVYSFVIPKIDSDDNGLVTADITAQMFILHSADS